MVRHFVRHSVYSVPANTCALSESIPGYISRLPHTAVITISELSGLWLRHVLLKKFKSLIKKVMFGYVKESASAERKLLASKGQ